MSSLVSFAHLGGIDEVVIYLVPILLAIVALRWMEKRAGAATDEKDGDQTGRTTHLTDM